MRTQTKIWMIGDSHARAFSYNNNFIPFFIGEGRKHCFINDNCLSNVISKVFKIIKEIEAGDAIVLLFGEPDTRSYLGRGWKPWKRRDKKKKKWWKLWAKKPRFSIGKKSKIKNSFYRYRKLICEIKNKTDVRLFILNITPSNRKDQNKLVDYFNKLLSEFCAKEKGVDFISINSDIYNPGAKTLRAEYYGDPVHLNMKIQLLVENWLTKKGILEKSLYDEKNKMDKMEIKKNYKFNEKFGSYTF